jgi:hypothetical protein
VYGEVIDFDPKISKKLVLDSVEGKIKLHKKLA